MKPIIISYFLTALATAFAFDSFTETGGTDVNLSSHTGENATWTHHPHANYTANTGVDAANDRIWAGGTSAYYVNASPASADYSVEADFYLASAISQNTAICLRMDTTADTMYIVRLNGGTIWEMRRIVTGTSTTLTGGTTTNQLPSAGTAKHGKFVISGNQLSFYIEGVLEIGPITDSNISAAGKAGVRFSGAASATTGIHLDNFTASN